MILIYRSTHTEVETTTSLPLTTTTTQKPRDNRFSTILRTSPFARSTLGVPRSTLLVPRSTTPVPALLVARSTTENPTSVQTTLKEETETAKPETNILNRIIKNR